MTKCPDWIHPTLQKDCFFVHSFVHCEVLLMNNAHFPWLILVPKGKDLVEIQDLDPAQRNGVFAEVDQAGRVLQKLFQPKKINTAALGNIVSQLHIHVIARFENDRAWPKPVWGVVDVKPYEDPTALIDQLRECLIVR